ncbi:VOC family protein [Microbacterium sp. SLBN-111]|uniref:VOC family protein n=1 Tax=Microbacterium sp. SLBN-111 TaxID=3377733 RepID=UPI003C729AF2
MTVLGIGGLLLRSRDPEARAAWYRDLLGIPVGAEGSDAVWMQDAGPTVFAPVSTATADFASDQPFLLNLRVTDLDAIVRRLEDAGVVVERRDEWETDYGRFVRLHDPEGLPIELWELPPDSSPQD